MGLQDRDYYRECLKEKEKLNKTKKNKTAKIEKYIVVHQETKQPSTIKTILKIGIIWMMALVIMMIIIKVAGKQHRITQTMQKSRAGEFIFQRGFST